MSCNKSSGLLRCVDVRVCENASHLASLIVVNRLTTCRIEPNFSELHPIPWSLVRLHSYSAIAETGLPATQPVTLKEGIGH
jgi:hypothetical protein